MVSRIVGPIAALALLFAASMEAAAAPASSYIDPASLSRLVSGEAIRSSSSGTGTALKFALNHPAADRMRAAIVAEAPDVIVEALFFMEWPSALGRTGGELTAYNILRAIGSLQGIQYYSASRGKMRLLYEYSSRIAGPDDPAPVRDERLSGLPRSPETLYARQKDTTFGDNRYRVTMSGGPDYVEQSSTNLTRMSLGIVPVAGPDDLSVRILAVTADDGILFYVVSSTSVAIMPMLRDRLEESFVNRAAAVQAWFQRELAKTAP